MVAANARRLGIMYMIRDKRIWGAYSASAGWRPYECSGVTGCHQDHVHFSFTWAGVRRRTAYWTGAAAPHDYGPGALPGRTFAPVWRAPNPAPCVSAHLCAADPLLQRLLRDAAAGPLALGATGPAVADLQNALGCLVLGCLVLDGSYGVATDDRVRSFQARNGPPAGPVTPAVWAALIGDVSGQTVTIPAPVAQPKSPALPPTSSAPAAPVPGATSRRSGSPQAAQPPTRASRSGKPVPPVMNLLAVLKLGSVGPDVTALQRALRLTPDGIFGQHTRAAVVAFQRAHRLPATGEVDARNRTLLTLT
jgi:peptidoglycan hydrolase-like protein with peptidoglycan-binding domain